VKDLHLTRREATIWLAALPAVLLAPASAAAIVTPKPSVSMFDFLSPDEIADVQAAKFTRDLSVPLAQARHYCATQRATPLLIFPAGGYRYSRAPDWGYAGARLRGDGMVVLRYTGSDTAFPVTDAARVGLFGLRVDNLTIEASTSARNCILLSSIHHAVLRDLNVRGCGGAALRIDFAVCTRIENFVCSHNRRGGGLQGFSSATPPRIGIHLTRRGENEPASYCLIDNPIVEGTGVGCLVEHGLGCVVQGGTFEGCVERGLVIAAGGVGTRVQYTDFEANGVEDVRNDGRATELLSIDSEKAVTFGASAAGGSINGGQFESISLLPGARGIRVSDIGWNRIGHGRLSDGGGNRWRDLFDSTRKQFSVFPSSKV
jgi:hypothetical protein